MLREKHGCYGPSFASVTPLTHNIGQFIVPKGRKRRHAARPCRNIGQNIQLEEPLQGGRGRPTHTDFGRSLSRISGGGTKSVQKQQTFHSKNLWTTLEYLIAPAKSSEKGFVCLCLKWRACFLSARIDLKCNLQCFEDCRIHSAGQAWEI